MYFKRKDYPQESEIVVCKVTNVQFHSVFVNLEEYGKSGMLHISEVSPGRIRSVRDYVSEGKIIVCKVLRIDKKQGHIDVSLRRVNENQRKDKLSCVKQEQKAEKICDFVAEKLKIDPKSFYEKVSKIIFENYEYLHEAFNDYVVDEFDLASLKLPKKEFDLLDEIIRQRIKPPTVEIKAKIKIECYEGDGLLKVKKILNEIKSQNETIKISYLGAGTYMFEIMGDDYTEIQPYYEGAEKIIEKYISKTCECSIKKQ
jgi:translation initiation factor 2 subunit 1